MSIEEILRWSSLKHELALETQLFGFPSKRVQNWLHQQLNFIHDPDFARLFSDNIDRFDVEPSAYNHRLIETEDGAMLAGIRFYGLDVDRPFVDVIAHEFSDLYALRKHVKEHWCVFAPQFVRLTAPAHEMPTADAVLDCSIHGAQYAQMAEATEQVSLSQDADVCALKEMIDVRYERVKRDHPQLRRNTNGADLDDLTSCHENGDLYVAHVAHQSEPIGMFCIRDSAIGWLQGDEVVEEVIVSSASGHGYAAHMQMSLATLRAKQTPERLMIGTIDRYNHASRKSAERAGRPEIMRRVFLPL
ncbi:hypothetical protein [Maritalea porphyrae]|uniref:hypothetical protein n=1 Tax=Maritalea porphyrae TaxID=880732 RepID=UPI0022AE6C2C|nr:hypothetical protein [Maritalea porphyrae]MCZ4273902.1 hypothetical protein [Maritalea porphyrae]